ncbi:MAG: hypothetical protein RLZZ303_2436 [Candidatus Hydrogenedentota bacterium]|jgi:hypothetical protein
MRNFSAAIFFTTILALGPGIAHGGTTTIDFTQGTGNLVQLGSGGSLTVDSECRALLTGATSWAIGNGSTPVTSTGTTSITVNITPASDLGFTQDFALFLRDPNTGDVVTATVEQNGDVTLTNGLETDSAFFGAPAAPNAAFTLTYNLATDTATVTIAGFANTAVIQPAFPFGEGDAPQIGVLTTTGARFRSLSATGAGIPELNSTGTCGGPEGEEEGEGSAEEGEGEELPVVLTLGGGFIESGSRLELSLSGASGAVGYQWRKNGVDLPGEESSTLVRDPVSGADSGTYRCAVDIGAKAVVLSEPALVNVVAPGGLPASGGVGLALLAGALALAATLRRR